MFDSAKRPRPAWRIEHLLRLMIAALILLATMLLGIGERSATLTLVSLAALAVSAYVADSRNIVRLKQPMANSAALGVMVVSAINAYGRDRHGQLLAVADLQSYLQYVLLFQPKTTRIYWQLALLSLGQVAIASTLVPGPLFGVLLLAYLIVGAVTFTLLLFESSSKRVASSLAARTARGSGMVLAGGSAVVDMRGLVRGLWGQGIMVGSAAVLGAVIVFPLLPRWDIKNPEVATREPLRSVGFSKTVTLGELNEVVDDVNVVMRIEFYHGRDHHPFRLIGDPLFRGTVVSYYENGSWTHPQPGSPMSIVPQSHSQFVRQRIRIESLDVPEVCCVFPVFALEADSRLRISTRRDELLRHEDYQRTPVTIELGTTGIIGNRQRRIFPTEPLYGWFEPFLQMEADDRPGVDRFSRLRQTATNVLSQEGIDPTDVVAAADALNRYLGRSGQYFYSLEPQQRDASLDPLEDFVTLHKVGHCEYFAGALVMMLRSQNIPARMAIGFKGGEWNSLGMYYQVQQFHAHAWVEVLLRGDQIPEGALTKDEAGNTAWMILDPTEGAQEAAVTGSSKGLLSRWNQYLDYATVLWTNYVVALNTRRQQEEIYGPLVQSVGQTAESMVGRQAWKARRESFAASPLAEFLHWYRYHWFSWRGALLTAAVLLAVAGLVWCARCAISFDWWRWAHPGAVRAEPPVLEIYRRLEAALLRHGLRRLPTQTPYEFALAAGGELAEHVECQRLAPLPRRVVEAFYRVRFGRRALDKPEAEAVELALAELERTPTRSQ